MIKYAIISLFTLSFYAANATIPGEGGSFQCAKGENYQETVDLGPVALKLKAICRGEWSGTWDVTCYDDGDASQVGVSFQATAFTEGGISDCMGQFMYTLDIPLSDFRRYKTECEAGKGADKVKLKFQASSAKGKSDVNLCEPH